MLSRVKPGGRERGGDRGLADAVHRRVDDRQVAGVADRLADDGRDVRLVDLGPGQDDRAVLRAPSSSGFSGISRSEAALTHSMMPASSGGIDLAAGRRVALEAVVRRRVVRRRDHDAGVAVRCRTANESRGVDRGSANR